MTSPRALLLTLAGFIVWGSAVLALYGLLSLGCRLGWESVAFGATTVQRIVLTGAFAVHLLALAGLTWWTYRRWRTEDDAATSGGRFFVISVSFYASAAALGATIFNFAAIFWLTPCETHQAAHLTTCRQSVWSYNQSRLAAAPVSQLIGWDLGGGIISESGGYFPVRKLFERTRKAQAMRLARRGIGNAGPVAIMRIEARDIDDTATGRSQARTFSPRGW